LLAEGPYSAAWRRYRRWSRAFWLAFVLYLPALAVVSHTLGWARDNQGAIFVAALVWMAAFVLVGYQKGNFRCPRCGEPFFYKFDARPWRQSWQHNPFARHCLHCRLIKWAAADPDSAHP
jgi:hypothetical protein